MVRCGLDPDNMSKNCLLILIICCWFQMSTTVQFRTIKTQSICTKNIMVAVPDDLPKVDVYLYNTYYYDFLITPQIFESPFRLPVCDDVRVLTHGFEQTRHNLYPLVNAFLTAIENVSVIILDYNSHCTTYKHTFKMAESIGSSIYKIMMKMDLITYKTLDTFQFIGFGLGAHIFGFAGRKFDFDHLLGLIIGLDPTVSGYDEDSDVDRERMLNTESALHVRIVHTGGYRFGIVRPMGHTDIYMNGGIYQPGCDDEEDESCSHVRALDYMVEAVLNNNCIEANRCASFYDLIYNYECRIVPNSIWFYSFEEDTKILQPANLGVYYVATSHFPPYFMTNYRLIYVANNVVHVSHTNGVYGSDYPQRTPCPDSEDAEQNTISYASSNIDMISSISDDEPADLPDYQN